MKVKITGLTNSVITFNQIGLVLHGKEEAVADVINEVQKRN